MSNVLPVAPVPPRDPTNDSRPDFAKPRYTDQVQGLMGEFLDPNNVVIRAARTRAEAIEAMEEVWEDEHDEAVTEWEEYLTQREEDEEKVRQAEKDSRKKRANEVEAELDKKRPKMPAYIKGQMVQSSIPIIASKFAREKLKDRKFCELWYWTREGIAEARRSGTAATSTADADGGLDIGNGVFIKTGGNQPSKKVIPDAALLMSQVSPAMALWIQGMLDEKYDVDHVRGWVDCKHMLENDTRWRHSELGDVTIVRYLAEIRYEWYNWISGTGDAFDLALISDERMHRIQDELMRERLSELQVRKSCNLRLIRTLMRSFPFPLLLHLSPLRLYRAFIGMRPLRAVSACVRCLHTLWDCVCCYFAVDFQSRALVGMRLPSTAAEID